MAAGRKDLRCRSVLYFGGITLPEGAQHILNRSDGIPSRASIEQWIELLPLLWESWV